MNVPTSEKTQVLYWSPTVCLAMTLQTEPVGVVDS